MSETNNVPSGVILGTTSTKEIVYVTLEDKNSKPPNVLKLGHKVL